MFDEINITMDNDGDLITRAEAVKAALDWYVRPHEDVFDSIKYAIIERMHAVPKAEGWVSVKDQLPEPASAHNMKDIKPVLLYSPKGGYYVGWYYGPDWNGKKLFINRTSKNSRQYITTKVTHWMPLPELPKENEDV